MKPFRPMSPNPTPANFQMQVRALLNRGVNAGILEQWSLSLRHGLNREAIRKLLMEKER